MRRVTRCVFCEGTRGAGKAALVAPFVRARALSEAAPEESEFRLCLDCGGAFFVDRFDDAEMRALYRDYRGAEYLATRSRHEFWYTETLNRGLGAFTALRRSFIGDVLERSGLDLARVSDALDFGGDTGELFPEALPRERCWVVEPSGVAPTLPLRAVRTLDELGDRRFGLILAAQVFEHLSEPRVELARLCARLAPGGVVYVEVPDERVRDLSFPPFIQRTYLAALRRRPVARLAAEMWSLAGRRLGVLPPFGFRKLHEHINVFSESALARLAPEGFEAIVSSEELRIGRQRTKLLVAVYRRRGSR